ncbi:peptidoglycan DD-metalloendopeptidase family protein [Deinococcus sp.]|uniref:peptidoglycan DD-metalloendopeptidase family protein n=1 Tax=Deinococcus sp. TaxID=47478 RepID=UPI0025FD1D23|nr:peptidoglycan DD-metalloendopeptidase family protein [Deinococcus sp.]
MSVHEASRRSARQFSLAALSLLGSGLAAPVTLLPALKFSSLEFANQLAPNQLAPNQLLPNQQLAQLPRPFAPPTTFGRTDPPRPRSEVAFALIIARRAERPIQIAERYGVAPIALRLLGGPGNTRQQQIPPRWPLREGQLVRLALPLERAGRRPLSVRRVTVRPGDTLSSLGALHNLSERELISANLELGSLDKLSVGTVLNIPTRETGLLIRIKPGQSAADLIEGYRADPLRVARANALILPTELSVGDELLLPGIFAASRQGELLARRLRAIQQARAARLLAQYQAYQTWKAERLRERQQQFDNFQAWLRSPERQAAVDRYKRQAEYDAWLSTQAAEDARAAEQIRAEVVQLARTDPRPQMQAALNAEQAAPKLELRWPLDHPRLTSRFGEQDIEFHQDVFHGGLDMAQPTGTPVYAAHAGTVTQSGDGAYGTNVYTVDEASGLSVIYGHLSAVSVTLGQVVRPGDPIGQVGCTGDCTGPHLHFELRLSGTPVDPLVFLP